MSFRNFLTEDKIKDYIEENGILYTSERYGIDELIKRLKNYTNKNDRGIDKKLGNALARLTNEIIGNEVLKYTNYGYVLKCSEKVAKETLQELRNYKSNDKLNNTIIENAVSILEGLI